MDKIALEIVAISHSITQSHSYAVVLGEKDGLRKLPIVIGGFEAQAIAVAIEKVAPSRPLTHDLLKNLFDQFSVTLKEVVINNLLDGVFYAQLICEQNGKEIEIDSRTSDALALAVRFNCPISTYDFVLDQAGIVLEDAEFGEEGAEFGFAEESSQEEDTMSLEELKAALQDALDKEDYERAASLRDEIKKRSPN